ncbi:MAG: alanine--tRNA ligase [Vicinamibacterales bacterium]
MTSNDIRRTFLEYFQKNGHRVVASSPLVPGDDPTLLFTNAGMNQFKDVFLGREKREYTRATTSQKVMRVSGKHNDLDNVGPSHRHHTFFEMLGNFSFGDYFKADAIEFAWKMLTEVWGMPADKLVVSVFKGEHGIPRDSEAYDIWRKFVPADRIMELGADDNFWQMGDTGPCGRCSEIYFVRGGTGADPEIEIWNNVFMEFERSADGTLTPLPAPSIDTGMGLERITAVLQGKESNYDTDLFQPLLRRVGELASKQYGDNEQSDISMRVVADHSRAMTFLIGDGVIPSNEWRGYVLRKIMRRAMRHGKHLGLTDPFLHEMVAVIAREMGDAYPDLRTNQEMISKTITAEENRFDAVLKDGLPRLEAEISKALESSKVLSGDAAFKLYDTFGVPYDFIEDTAATRGASVDREGFERAMEGQRDKARAGSTFGGGKKGLEFMLPGGVALDQVGDQFEGYTSTLEKGVPVVALFDAEGQSVDMLSENATGYAALGRTPFYLEAGGQVSDTGRLVNEATGASAVVEGMVRIKPWLPRAHRIRVESGALHVRDMVTAQVDETARNATRRNHTATHLLHAALRQVLGTHVKQAGSLVSPDRLRFDFAHFQPVTADELPEIERIVNAQVVRNTPVTTEVKSTQEAMASGAMALFGEKYGDRVRVVSVPGFSVELCGGTHVSATGDIGSFQIVAESGVAAGVRRIEAITGMGAVLHMQEQRATLQRVLDALHANAESAVDTIERLQGDAKKAAREISQLKTKLAMGGGASGGGDEVIDVAGVKLARKKVADLDKDALRGLADSLKASIGSGVVVIASENEGKVQMVVAVTPDLSAKVKAGAVVKALAPIVGGGGGGRPDFAEAGGKLPEKIDEMLAAAPDALKALL